MDNKGLSITCFGTPQVFFNGQPIKFRSRKVLALFLYLLIAGGRHGREQLIAILWPQADAKRGRLSLRGAISQVRQSLKPAGEFLLSEQDWVSVDRSQAFHFDLDRLSHALNPKATVAQLESGTAVPATEFFAGFTIADVPDFEDWVIVQRELWQQRLEAVLVRLCQHYLDSLQSEKVIKLASDWVARTPHNETAYRVLMEAQALIGNRTAALQIYDAAVLLLEKELGVEPAPETVALAERIRANEIAANQTVWAQTDDAKIRPLPYVGRSDIQANLVSRYRQAATGEPQVVALIGEAGVGKTKTAVSFQNWLQLQSDTPDILTGRAFEMGGHLPYQPLVSALRNRLELENAPDDLLADVWLTELSQLFPELRDRYPDLPTPMSGDPQSVKARIYEAVTQLLHALAIRCPVVFVVDDLQWADSGTLELLAYVNGRLTELESRILLLFTIRQEAMIATASSLANWLSQIERTIPVTRQTVGLLETQHIVEMLAALSDDPHAPTVQTFAQLLFQQSNGHPFYLTEIMQMLFEDDVLTSSESGIDLSAGINWMRGTEHPLLPQSVKIVVSSRLQRQSENGRLLLTALAIFGRNCSFDHLCAVAQMDEEDGLIVLEKLIESRLVHEGQGYQPYTFAHDIVRTVVYTQTGEARRRIYHRRALAQLESESAPPAQLAYHAHAAHLLEQSFRYALRAGEDALAIYALADAIEQFEQAYRSSFKTAVSDDDLLKLYQQRGRTFELLHQFDVALENYQTLSSLAQERTNQTLQLAALIAQATLYIIATPMYDPNKAKGFAEQSIHLAQSLGDRRTEAKALWSLMLIYHRTVGDNSQARTYGETGLQLARETGDLETLAYLLTDLTKLYIFIGEFGLAETAVNEAIILWRKLSNVPMLLDSLTDSGTVYGMAGAYKQALQLTDEGFALASKVENGWNQCNSYAAAFWSRRELGLYATLLPQVKLIIQLSRESMPTITFYYQLLHAIALSDLGQFEQAEAICTAVFAESHNFPMDIQAPAIVRTLHAQMRLRQGDLNGAVDLLTSTPYDHTRIMLIPVTIIAWLAEIDVVFASGKFDQVLSLTSRQITLLENAGATFGLVKLYEYQGKALVGQGNLEAGIEAFRRGTAVATETDTMRSLWSILAALADEEEAIGHSAQAAQLRQEARATLQTIINQIPEGELRASFLALTEVTSLLA